MGSVEIWVTIEQRHHPEALGTAPPWKGTKHVFVCLLAILALLFGAYLVPRCAGENFDTGELTEPTAYPFADKAYAKLLDKVTGKPVSDALRSDILAFYADLGAPFATKKDPRAWQAVLDELGKLKALPATGVSE